MILSGEKNFEVRRNDHDFQVGDVLILEEWNPATELYTGYSLERSVTYILPGGNFGIDKNYCVMSLGTTSESEIIHETKTKKAS